MTFPFTELSAGFRQQGLVFATLIGIAFGFVLERAGFGRADKLAAQFYLRDMRVFKVMFSAIVTAMLGLMIVSGIGLADLRSISESIASFTWIWPMLAGGFLLGIGFIVSGYCPGTSIVAMGSGNIDGAFTVAGVITGTFIYTKLLLIPAVARFHESGAKGSWFLYDLIKVPPETVAAGVTVIALLAFLGAEKVESIMSHDPDRRAPRRRLAFATMAVMAAVALATIAIPEPASARQSPSTIRAGDLAKMLVDAPWSVRVLDVRDAKAFAASRIAGAQNIDPASLRDVTGDGRTLVIVGSADNIPARALVLAGGMAAWNADPFVQAMTSGAPPPPPPPVATGVITKPKKKGGGCSS
jgi:uncharacterized membrane protein YedE/YeeE/rhodanese-related sulfurtransferase